MAELQAKNDPTYLECSVGGTPGSHQAPLRPFPLLSKAHHLWRQGGNWSQKLPGPTFIFIPLGELFYFMPFISYTWCLVKVSWGSLRG